MKILYLFPRDLYETKMSVGRILYGTAVSRRPGVELEYWGAGWPGYDESRTLEWNLEVTGRAPDVLWVYKQDRLREFRHAPWLKLTCFNECWNEKYIAEADGCDLVVFRHQVDHLLWDMRLTATGVMTRHILHGADPEFFVPHQKTTDCLLTGVSAPQVYPLRARFEQMLRDGRLPGRIRKHPGYRLRSHAECLNQYRDYADDLGGARISLCCSSKWRYSLAKYMESALAGCAIAGDMPDDELFRSTLGRHMIEIDTSWSDDGICEVIRDWLRHPNELAALAERGRQCVLDNFTTAHYARHLVNAIECAAGTLTGRGAVGQSVLPELQAVRHPRAES